MNPWKRREVIGNATLYLGDCIEVLNGLRDGCQNGDVSVEQGGGAEIALPTHIFDAVITDPPYGVLFAGSATRWNAPTGNAYVSYEDTPENVAKVCVPAIELSRTMATRVCLTPGIRNARLYPQPDGEGVIWYPSGANRGPWGFVTHQPIYYYGKCPYLATGKGSMPTGFQSTEPAEENGHPCPKPIRQMMWLVKRASLERDIVCDPFMGSGTTGVACMNLGRRFVGIEIEERYFNIACERIENAQRQKSLLDDSYDEMNKSYEQVKLL